MDNTGCKQTIKAINSSTKTQNRQLLAKQLKFESELVKSESMKVLHEFERVNYVKLSA